MRKHGKTLDPSDEELLISLGDEVRANVLEYLTFVKCINENKKGDNNFLLEEMQSCSKRLVRSIVKLVKALQDEMFEGEVTK